MLCVPPVSAEVGKVATPLPLTGELPIFVVLSKKFTVPVGVPLKTTDVTIAVKLTACPNVDGFGEEVSAVVVCPALKFISTPTAPFAPPQVLLKQLAATMSGLLSPFRSATATPTGVIP